MPSKYHTISEMGSLFTRHTMETFFPLGTVRYMEVGLRVGLQANSARERAGTRMPSRRRGPWQTGSTGRGTLLWESQRRKERREQSHSHLLGENSILFIDYINEVDLTSGDSLS